MSSSNQASSKLWTPGFVAGTCLNFLLMVNYYALMVVMTEYAMGAFDAPASLAGLVASVFIIGALVARVVAGGIIERVGRKRLLVIGAVGELVFSLLYFFGSSLGFLFLVRIVHGFAYGISSTTISTIVTSAIPIARKGEGVGYYTLSVTLGAALGPFLGVFLIEHGSFHAIFYVCVITAALCAVIAFALHVPASKLSAAGSGPEKAGAAGMPASAEEPSADCEKVSRPSSRGRVSDLLDACIERSTIPIGLVCAVIFFCYSSLLAFLAPYAKELDLVAEASFFFVVYALAMFATRPLTGRAFDRRGAKAVMIPAFLSFMVGMVVLGFATNAPMLLGSAALLGFGVGTIQSSGLALAVRHTPDARLGVANSTFYVLIDVGVGIGPLVLGLLQPALGYGGLYLSMAVVALIALVAYFGVDRRYR